MLVADDAVEALLAFLQALHHGEVGPGGKAEGAEQLAGVDFRFLDAHGDFDFLLAGEQGHLAHLLQVHADRDRPAHPRGRRPWPSPRLLRLGLRHFVGGRSSTTSMSMPLSRIRMASNSSGLTTLSGMASLMSS
jgi:hypothetical protein